MSLRTEIFEQPQVIARLLETQGARMAHVAEQIHRRNPAFVLIAARGSSDNAGRYAKYLWGSCNRLPVALAAPSLFSVYDTPPAVGNALIVGISQSGQSPDIVAVLREGRRQGALTLALTNDPDSPLAAAAELCVDLMTGPENAVAATKTYTAELTVIAMLSAALSDDRSQGHWLGELPSLVSEALARDAAVASAAIRYRYMSHCAVLGRGFNYATAFEWALKLKELAYVIAEPYSPADFQHGPKALASEGFPLFVIAPTGRLADEIRALAGELVRNQRVELLAVSNDRAVLDMAHTSLAFSGEVPEWLSPIPAVVLSQLFCFHLTRAKGHDTEAPRGLSKVTRTM